MALTVAGVTLTERHRRDQLNLRSRFLREFLRLWPLLNPANLDESAAVWIQLVVDLVLMFRGRAVDQAVTYYDHLRAAEIGEGLADLARFRGLDAVNHTAIRTSLSVTGPIGIKYRIGKGERPEQAAKVALVQASGAASRHVLNGGRHMLTTMVRSDAQAVGFARTTSDSCCYFCAMLASRGPVYKTRATAETKHGASEPYHDLCQCGVEPAFHVDAPWPGRSREFEKLWEDATGGHSGKRKLAAFRQAYAEFTKQEASLSAI